MNHSHQTNNPFYPSTGLGVPCLPNYYSCFFGSHFSHAPSNSFCVPTPPSSAPPNSRSTSFSYDFSHSPSSLSPTQLTANLIPQNLSLRHESPLSPISHHSPLLPPNYMNSMSEKPEEKKTADHEMEVSIRSSVSSLPSAPDIEKRNRAKEVTLKHRLLRPRPPDIKIEDSVNFTAPMSAPPFDGVTEKTRFDYPNSTKSSSSSLSSSSSTSLTSSSKNLKHIEAPKRSTKLPLHFRKGSLIQLEGGRLKPVEQMETEDFIESTKLSKNLSIEKSKIIGIRDKTKDSMVLITFAVGESKREFTIEANPGHPFFVLSKGWCSCSPLKSGKLFDLNCEKLAKGDVCITLTQKIGSPKRNSKKRSKSSGDDHFNQKIVVGDFSE